MNKIFIFSGTTEGRKISEFLSQNSIYNEVFVATEYGDLVMSPNEYTKVEQGRLDQEAMKSLFETEKPELIIDATHPYAVEVTKNIVEAAKLVGLEHSYIRVSREIDYISEEEDLVKLVDSTEEAIAYLKEQTSGNILLTTGVKELEKYASSELVDRIYARILPGKESMEKAFELPILPRQIIAMEGPFSKELNEALIKQFDIKVLVTKNSGVKGGFIEKLDACKALKIKAVVIQKAEQISGISYKAAKTLLAEKYDIKKNEGEVSVVGIGMGTGDSITVAGLSAIKSAQVIIGAKRMALYGKSVNPDAEIFEEYKKDEVVKLINEHKDKRVAVLVSGDTGFFSLADGIAMEKIRIIPAVSSFSYLSARIGFSYSDADIVSFHGKESESYKFDAKKVFSIFTGCDDAAKVVEANPEYNVYLGYNLGMESEDIFEFSGGIINEELQPGLYVGCFVRVR